MDNGSAETAIKMLLSSFGIDWVSERRRVHFTIEVREHEASVWCQVGTEQMRHTAGPLTHEVHRLVLDEAGGVWSTCKCALSRDHSPS